MRLFACPRRPSRMKLCRERIALTSCGTTRVVVADDAGEERLAGPELAHQVLTDFVLDASARNIAEGDGSAEVAKRGDGLGAGHAPMIAKTGP